MENKKQTIRANGKLLLSAEYFVLDGAMAIALPSKMGQTFTFENLTHSDSIFWKSFDEKNQVWFEGVFDKNNFKATQTTDPNISDRLTQILKAIHTLNPIFLKQNEGVRIESHLDFPRNWGLGTSSTLIYALAKWVEVNPYVLLELTFGGSGYDIACASMNSPFFFQINNNLTQISPNNFAPDFLDQLYFIFLNKKQNSREGIFHYRKLRIEKSDIENITDTSLFMHAADSLQDFEKWVNSHEDFIANKLNLPKVKNLFFSDYWGSVKSLGAWGGDFVLATSNRSEEETRKYFNEKGFEVFFKYKELILATD